MHCLRRTLPLLVSVLTVSCGTSLHAPPSTPTRQVEAVDPQLAATSVTASSSLNWKNTTFSAMRAVDNNTDLEWASSDGDTDPWLALTFGQRYTFDHIFIKTWPGSRFVVQRSNGAQWVDASSTVTSRNWQLQRVAVRGTGGMLRVHFLWPPPSGVNHFSIFEIKVYGSAAGQLPPTTAPVPPPAPVPPAPVPAPPVSTTPQGNTLVEMSDSGAQNGVDYMGSGGIGASGSKDGHLRLTGSLPQTVTVDTIDLYELNSDGSKSGNHWASYPSSLWAVGVIANGNPLVSRQQPLLTLPAGTSTADLYGEDPGGVFGRGNPFEVDVKVVGYADPLVFKTPGAR